MMSGAQNCEQFRRKSIIMGILVTLLIKVTTLGRALNVWGMQMVARYMLPIKQIMCFVKRLVFCPCMLKFMKWMNQIRVKMPYWIEFVVFGVLVRYNLLFWRLQKKFFFSNAFRNPILQGFDRWLTTDSEPNHILCDRIRRDEEPGVPLPLKSCMLISVSVTRWSVVITLLSSRLGSGLLCECSVEWGAVHLGTLQVPFEQCYPVTDENV